ncbi:MAG: ABC transporter permease [Chitinophagales bacterium]|nr:ABC transporter permease [Chitinophagales bacterium]MDW8394438.1 ABC transporter permease [Chitinophagales bacterium]
MLSYVLRRLLWFIPTLLIISLLGFYASVLAPGDPLQRLIGEEPDEYPTAGLRLLRDQERRQWIQRMGLDLPVFYLELVPLAFPDTLHRIYDRNERRAARYWLLQSGSGDRVYRYRQALHQALLQAEMPPAEPDTSGAAGQKMELRTGLRRLLTSHSKTETDILLNQLYGQSRSDTAIGQRVQAVRDAYAALLNSSEHWKAYVPVVRFHMPNQYHRWLFGDGHWLSGSGATETRGVLRGDFGISYASHRPVSELLSGRIGWSVLFALLSTLLAYLISVPVGVHAAVRHGKRFDHLSSLILFVLNSMPSFWVGSLLILLLANPAVLALFPASGIMPAGGYPPDAGLLKRMLISLPYVVLPLIAYTYGSLAFLSRMTRQAMLEALHQDYVRTARAKGLPERLVIWRHAFRNSLLPLITVFSHVFPAAIGGSVVLETVFSIPGMGLEAVRAVTTQDFPVVVAVFTLAGLFSVTGFLVADLLYAVADPRIKYRS